ncbi:Rad52/Rad22 family DNA repair protein [Streptomyces cinereoruber]|uniref:Rad52/Rad22 family DNA repair protein n=1 Tax=Streptomyces cinereoruber TaxID=67260 RepID=UPI003644C66F
MATAAEAPATTAEGPTQHVPNQPTRFTPYQLRMLHGGINGNRVRNLRGMSHLEAWDVRRQLIRIFGFGGFDVETLSLDLVSERETKTGERSRWTIVYRAQVRLIIKDTHGRTIAHFDDGAAGDAVNQPSIGDAHDLAMKTAFSQALKRCAVNLGDQFGLSLYNDGSQDAVVNFSAAHPPQEWKAQSAPPVPEPNDPPVRPEPGAEEAQPDAPRPASTATGPEPGPAPAHLDRLMVQVRDCWNNPLALSQIKGDAEQHQVLDHGVQGPPPTCEWMPFRTLIDRRFAELKQASEDRNAERNAS